MYCSLVNRTKVLFITIFLFIGVADIFPQTAQAKLKATSEYNVSVTINEKGRVWVEYKIHLINQSDNFFIRDYSLIFEHKDLTGLKVTENGNPISFEKEFLDDKVRVKAKLRNELVQKGSATNISFLYETRQIFLKEGLLWKLYIPAIKTEEDMLNAYVRVEIPEVYGELSDGYFKDKSIKKQEGKNIITFRQQDRYDGLLLLLGTSQQYEFTYLYTIENLEDKDQTYTITLPPDTKDQTVFYLTAQPQPEQTIIARDDNVMVKYILKPGEKKEIKVAGFTRYSLPTNYTELQINRDIYLQEGEIWDYSSESSQKALESIVKDTYSTYEKARFIYDFVISSISHSFENDDGRLPISKILSTQGDVYSCLHYSDLFVGLARGAGVPARTVVGYTTSQEKTDVLHYWGEFYDDQRKNWIAVDPCFEDSFGFNEFDQIDLNRIIVGYWENTAKEIHFLMPYESYQKDHPESIKISASSQSYLENQQFAYVDTSVGTPNFFKKNIPLNISVSNQSQSIFSLKKVFIDEDEISAYLVDNEFFPAVFPTQTKDITINLGSVDAFDYDPSKLHSITLIANHNGGEVTESREFGLRGALTLLHLFLWVVAGGCAVITIGIVAFIVRRIRSFDAANNKIGGIIRSRLSRIRLRRSPRSDDYL